MFETAFEKKTRKKNSFKNIVDGMLTHSILQFISKRLSAFEELKLPSQKYSLK